MVHGSFDEPVSMELVNPGVTGMGPMTVAAGIDQECCKGAVRLFFGGNRSQLDHDMRFFHHLAQCNGRVVCCGIVALEELLRCEHDLV